MKVKLLLILFLLTFILYGCQEENKDVVVIDITDEEMESITETMDKLPEKLAPPVPKPLVEDELIQVGIITGETIQSQKSDRELYN